jgi:quercetin dioxygenase-like cupin family protein
MRQAVVSAGTVVLVLIAAAAGVAQQPAFKRTEVQRGDLLGTGREAVQVIAELPGGVASGRHSHPGEEIAFVLEGPVVLEIDGEPARTLKTGEGFIVPAGRVHNARNAGTAPARVLATYVVEKGKPLATPAAN